jgi:hypothetical protein
VTVIDPNDPTIENQPGNRESFRLTLNADDKIPGLTKPSVADPDGVMVKGPWDNLVWTLKLREQAEVASQLIMEATYDLDYLEADIDLTSGDPVLTYTDASPTWENVFTQNLAALGEINKVVDWPNEGLTKKRAPTAVRFRFGTAASKQVRIAVEERIL